MIGYAAVLAGFVCAALLSRQAGHDVCFNHLSVGTMRVVRAATVCPAPYHPVIRHHPVIATPAEPSEPWSSFMERKGSWSGQSDR